MITWNTDVNAPGCPGEILSDDGRSLLIQTDWDYCGVAQSFGWSLREVQRRECPHCGQEIPECDYCAHDGTDGTVDCDECGVTASEFIAAAYDWLCDNDGAQAEDPGYFDQGDE